MKAKKAKEQLIAIALLSSVFIFFIYLKMNPGVSSIAKDDLSINKIIDKKVQEVRTTNLEKEKVEQAIENKLVDNKSIILFTEKELKRAKSYMDKDWKPDETINIAAWDYVSKNPIINESKEKQIDKTIYLESNQVVNAK
tara:strand:+ start:592 stop:1011 length:420 start_codon:yes stop_codon:yes gene_type:complete